MGVRFTVVATATTGGSQQTVNIPENNATLVGIITNDPLIKLPIDTTSVAIFGLATGTNAVVRAFWNVTYPVKGNSLLYTPSTTSSLTFFYFGQPMNYLGSSPKPLSAYKAVTANHTFAGAGSATVSFTFPAPGSKITGVWIDTGAAGSTQAAWNISTGESITIVGLSNEIQQEDSIVPVDNVVAPTTLTVTLTASAANTATVILYYQ